MILLVGDYIEDLYVWGECSRICPEAPVPVVIPRIEKTTAGGVGLVANQLRELDVDIRVWYGSLSRKKRVFAGSHLVCRIDEDDLPFDPDEFPDEALRNCDAVIVSDYGKGGMFEEIAQELIMSKKPLFVDAKNHWQWYSSDKAYWFPNELEAERLTADNLGNPIYWGEIQIIQKLGARGCKWGSIECKATVSDVVDTTGAGDIFIASFVYALRVKLFSPIDSLVFANEMAGESCRHRGTHVVSRAFAESVLDKIQSSTTFQLLYPGPVGNSMQAENSQWRQVWTEGMSGWTGTGECRNPHEDSPKEKPTPTMDQKICESGQTLHRSTSDHTDMNATQLHASQGSPVNNWPQVGHTGPSPNGISHQCERIQPLEED